MPKRTDANQREIVAALQAVGCSVESLHEVGHGVPDLLVGRHGDNYLIECKTDAGRLTPQQREFMISWRGQKAVVHDVAGALRVVGVEIQ